MYWYSIKFVSFVAVSGFLLLHSYYFKPSLSGDPNLRSRPTFPDLSFSLSRLGFAGSSAASSSISSATKCDPPIDIPDEYFMSQFQEDRMLMKWFGSICGGTYLELGAFDGSMYSNSFVFNKAMGWKGVLIEFRNDIFGKLVANRPDEIASINAGVCDKPQTLHAFYSNNVAVGGIYEYVESSFKETWWPGISLENDPRVQPIECDTLDNLLLMNAPGTIYFDFLSIDVIGAELAALRSIDFDRTQFGIVVVAIGADEMKNLAMRQLMVTKGYSFIADHENSYYFANLNFNDIYRDLTM
jgi:hypothetical protein